MIDRVRAYLARRQADRDAAFQQHAEQQANAERIQGMVTLLKDLLKDARYAAYTQLLTETYDLAVAEREAILRDAKPGWEREVLLLTGRIHQLDTILHTPQRFLEQAERLKATEATARPLAREPVGSGEPRSRNE